MQKKSITDIINEFKVIRDAFPQNEKIWSEIDNLVSELEKHKNSAVDRNIDRVKKVSDILAIFARIIHDYFNGSP